MSMVQYDIVGVLHQSFSREQVRDFIGESRFFDVNILSMEEEALRVWRAVARLYAVKEQDFHIPYQFAENTKLYALDALCIAKPLIADANERFKLAEFFTIFYLIVHLFDDHVEHRDKFYSKFDFSQNSDLDTQRGAAPFSFLLVSLALLQEILQSIRELDEHDQLAIMNDVHGTLARQTRYFASERQSNMSIDDILEVKQRQVSGKTLALFGDILARYSGFSVAQARHLHEGLVYLGSLTQITDDIRDRSIDAALRNANLVDTAYKLGQVAGEKKLDAIYKEEVAHAQSHLEHIYAKEYANTLLSLPFYPFMIDKQKLKEMGEF